MPKKNFPQSKPHYKGLTFKEGKLVDEFVRQATEEGKINRTKAALKVYNASPNSAATIGSRLFNRVEIREAYLEEMDARGLNDELSITTHRSIFNATKRQLDPDGGYTEVPDHAVQLRAVQEYHKLKGYYPDKKLLVDKRTATLNVYAEMTPQELAEAEAELANEVKELEGGGG